MYKLSILIALLMAQPATTIYGQKKKKEKKLNNEEARAVLDQLDVDSAYFLRTAGQSACTCIDSVDKAENDYDKSIEGISDCIDKQVGAYELGVQMASILKSPAKNHEILMSRKGSSKYKQTYFEIERWLKDSCNEMNTAIAMHDEVGEKSLSKNREAFAAYEKGVPLMQAEKYT